MIGNALKKIWRGIVLGTIEGLKQPSISGVLDVDLTHLEIYKRYRNKDKSSVL